MSFVRINKILTVGLGNNNLPLIARSQQQARSYAFKSDLKIKWIRPEKISCIKPEKSGDLRPIANVDLSLFPKEFQKSTELENASDLVRKVFSLEFTGRRRTMEVAKLDIVDSVKRHALDKGSMEAKIASMTGEIRNLQQHMDQFPRDKRTKVLLKEIIDKRKKFLKYLRRWDYKRFEWLLEKLDIVYKSPPSEFKWVTRKDSLRKLTDKHCEDVKTERLNAYRASLDAEKLNFLQNKVETLRWIQEEERSCQAETTVKQEDIDAVLEQIARLQVSEETKEEDVKAVN